MSVASSIAGGGGSSGGGAPTGAAGGDLSGTYPNPSVVNDSHSHTAATLPPLGATDHGALTGLADDDHAQYAALAGRAGGTAITGGTQAGDDLTLSPNSTDDGGNVTILQGPGGDALAVFRNGAIELRRDIYGFTGGRALILMTVAASETQPVFFPNDLDSSGLGRAGAGQPNLIASNIEVLRAAVNIGGATGPILYLRNLTTAPSTNPADGVYLYAEAGALKARGSSGTVTTIAPA